MGQLEQGKVGRRVKDASFRNPAEGVVEVLSAGDGCTADAIELLLKGRLAELLQEPGGQAVEVPEEAILLQLLQAFGSKGGIAHAESCHAVVLGEALDDDQLGKFLQPALHSGPVCRIVGAVGDEAFVHDHSGHLRKGLKQKAEGVVSKQVAIWIVGVDEDQRVGSGLLRCCDQGFRIQRKLLVGGELKRRHLSKTCCEFVVFRKVGLHDEAVVSKAPQGRLNRFHGTVRQEEVRRRNAQCRGHLFRQSGCLAGVVLEETAQGHRGECFLQSGPDEFGGGGIGEEAGVQPDLQLREGLLQRAEAGWMTAGSLFEVTVVGSKILKNRGIHARVSRVSMIGLRESGAPAPFRTGAVRDAIRLLPFRHIVHLMLKGGLMSLAGKTLFITGASRGIGLAIGLRAAQDGANVVIAAKTQEPHPRLPGTIYTAAKEIEAAGGQALPCVVDVRDEASVQGAVEQAVQQFGGLDILVNNASAIQLTGTLQTEMKRYDLMHQINTRGTYLCSQACLPALLKAENPHVLNISPPLNVETRWFAPHVAYTMAKFGMSLCVLGMAGEFRKQGVAFNALWPKTTIDTAAIRNVVGAELANRSRTPAIMADAAYEIFTRSSRDCTGNFFIDEDLLRSAGVSDFSGYAVTPGMADSELQADFFI